MFFSLFLCVCNITRTPGGLAGARLIAASQLAHDVSQPLFERSEDREREARNWRNRNER